MSVNPDHQRQGIGSMLMQRICEEADLHGDMRMCSLRLEEFHCMRNSALKLSAMWIHRKGQEQVCFDHLNRGRSLRPVG